LSGQRAVRRYLLFAEPHLARTGFGFEIALDRLAKARGIRPAHVSWVGVSHRLKSHKYGMVRGMRVSLRASSDLVRQVRVRRRRHTIYPRRDALSPRAHSYGSAVACRHRVRLILRPLFSPIPRNGGL